MNQRIIISTHLESEIANALSECEHDKIFILVDETTLKECLPVVRNFFSLKNAQMITIGATDTHKDLETIAHVWKSLGEGGASRHSCLINLGGGMVTDLQAWHQLHQHPYYPARYGRCFGGRQDGHQLQWTEE